MGAEEATPAPRYLAGGLSEKGRRESNEDAAILAVLPPSSALRAFAVLCDGMGGHNAGEVASRLAVEILKEKVQAFAARPDALSPPPAETEAAIREWIAEVNREIYQRGKASAEHKGMGTTVGFAMVLADDRLVVANVGDSRVFLVSGLSVRQLSVDHTALAEQRRALGSDSVAPEDDASNPFAHALTRSLGQEKKVEPDVRSDVTLGPGDVVILTTDGVTDVLEAERFLTALETTGSLQEAANEIYRLAFEAGSKDNISVALLSRGTPARLGLAKTGQLAGIAPAASPGGDEMLVAGAASEPPVESTSRPRASRRVAFGVAAVALLAVGVGVGVFLRRPAGSPAATGRPSSDTRAAGLGPTAFRVDTAGCNAAARSSFPFAAPGGSSGARRANAADAAPLSAARARAGRAVVPDTGGSQRTQAARVSPDADRDADRDSHADADRDRHGDAHDRLARASREVTSSTGSPAGADARCKHLRGEIHPSDLREEGIQECVTVKRAVVNLLVLATATVIGLALCEGLLRLTPSKEKVFEAEDFSRFDPWLGWSGRSNVVGKTRLADQDETFVHMNSRGLRDVEHGQKDRRRILCLGDSFTWGAGVRDDETYSRVLGQTGSETINSGVCGWGTAQELLWLERDGFQYDPDIVVLGFYLNDFADNATDNFFGSKRPIYVLENGRLALKGVPISERRMDTNARAFLLKHVVTFRLLYAGWRWFDTGFVHAADSAPVRRAGLHDDTGPKPPPAETETKAIIAETKRVCEAKGVRFVVLAIPSKCMVRSSSLVPCREQDEMLYASLLRICKTVGATVVEPLAELRASEASGVPVFPVKGWHWNAAGHRIAARALARTIAKITPDGAGPVRAN